MKSQTIDYLIIIVIAIITIGCKSEYTSYVDREMAKGIRYDSLIFDMKIGQKKKEFFAICWDLNKQKLISQGTGNTTARYLLVPDSTDMTKNIDMLFYGIFDEKEVMHGMRITYQFQSWAPWNKERNADALVQLLKQYYLDHYGNNEFIQITVEEVDEIAWVKIDGNRQILIYPVNDKDVRVIIKDLNYKNASL